MPEDATTQVWMTVFSCLVKGWLKRPNFPTKVVQILRKKKPKRPADTLSEGMIPVVRLSFITMKLNNMLSPKLTTKALMLSCFRHEGTSWFSNTRSTDHWWFSFFSSSSSSTSTSPSGFFFFILVESKPSSLFSMLGSCEGVIWSLIDSRLLKFNQIIVRRKVEEEEKWKLTMECWAQNKWSKCFGTGDLSNIINSCNLTYESQIMHRQISNL